MEYARIKIIETLIETLEGSYAIRQTGDSEALVNVEFPCIPLRMLYGTETNKDFIAVIESPTPTDPNSSSGRSQWLNWEMLVEASISVDKRTVAQQWREPFRMEKLMRTRLMSLRERVKRRHSFDVDNESGISYYMSDIVAGAGVVRADEAVPGKLFVWLPVSITYMEK